MLVIFSTLCLNYFIDMKTILSILLVTVFCSISCQRLAYVFVIKGRTGLNNISKFEHTESGKKITFIGMSHVETVQYYADVKNYLDSLRDDGYAIFFEGVTLGPNPNSASDSIATDIVLRKYRRLMGRSIAGAHVGFESVADNSGEKPGRLVQQTFERIGVCIEKDHLCDLTVPEIINGYELEYGEILLTDCDWDTPLREKKYKCRTEQKFRKDYAELILREDHIAKSVIASEYEKIVMVYGNFHMFTLSPTLCKDYGFECTDWLISEKKKK